MRLPCYFSFSFFIIEFLLYLCRVIYEAIIAYSVDYYELLCC